jgi:hypothetical protein
LGKYRYATIPVLLEMVKVNRIPKTGMRVQRVTTREVRKMLCISSCISDRSNSRLDFSACKKWQDYKYHDYPYRY